MMNEQSETSEAPETMLSVAEQHGLTDVDLARAGSS